VLTRFPSNVDSLKKGIIKTSKNKANKPYTILLLGETGVGKSSLLELIANVLTGNDIDDYDFNVLDHRNEQHGPSNQSQTNSARLYEFTSKNGIAVSIEV
jgi:predicted GTPase